MSEVTTIATKADLAKLEKQLCCLRDKKGVDRAFAIDTETYAPESNKMKLNEEALILDRGRIMIISMYANNHAYVIPLQAYSPEFLPDSLVLKTLQPFLSDKTILKCGHNLMYDINMFLNHGIKVNLDSCYCTLIAGHCWNESMPNSLKERCILVGMRLSKTNTVDFSDQDATLKYAALDAIATWKLYEGYERGKKISLRGKEVDMWLHGSRRKFFRMEMRLFKYVIQMERRGMRINARRLAKVDKKIIESINATVAEIYAANGEPFNIGSTKQLSELLFTKLRITPEKETPKGLPSCDKESLARIQHRHPVIKKIIKHNQLRSLRRFTSPETGLHNYCDANGRAHPTLFQCGAKTSRMSCSQPNMMQLPSKTDIFGIRNCVCAEKGKLLIVADKDQLELRLIAAFSRDKNMLKAFNTGESIHIQTGIKCGLLDPNMSKEEMKADHKYIIAKTVNFSLQYGGAKWTLEKTLLLEGIKISTDECQKIIDKYFVVYSGLRPWHEHMYALAREHGFIRNICGRPLYIEDINSSNHIRQNAAKRACINYTIQPSAADLIKWSMIYAAESEVLKELHCRMLMQIHDELIFEVPEKNAEEAAKHVKIYMEKLPPENYLLFEPPLKFIASIGIGETWKSAKK